jgi:hypothetical protein
MKMHDQVATIGRWPTVPKRGVRGIETSATGPEWDGSPVQQKLTIVPMQVQAVRRPIAINGLPWAVNSDANLLDSGRLIKTKNAAR